MSKEKVFADGIKVFAPHASAPDFVKGAVVITPNALFKWCKDNPELLSEYNGQVQLKLQILDGKNGLYMAVDTYKPTPKAVAAVESEKDDLPF